MQSTKPLYSVAITVLIYLLITPATVLALKSDMRKPISIEADRMDIDDSSGKSVYYGNVKLKQGSLTLQANKVTVIQSKGKGKSSKVIAEGEPAIMRQTKDGTKEQIEGRGNRLEYTVSSKLLLLIGKASLRQGGDTFRSDRIVYNREQSTIKAGASAKGKQRVRITIGGQ